MAGDNVIPPPRMSPNQTEAKAPSVKVFECPACGAGVTLRAMGQSVSAVCGSCQAIIDTTNDNYKIIQQVAKKMAGVSPLIPLGQRGKIRGILWEVIGWMRRTDGTGIYHWDEYLLFNPTKGFRWLTEFDGHWNYVITTKEKPRLSASYLSGGNPHASYLGKTYKLFLKGSAITKYVLGEFYWQVRVGDKVSVADYIAPPEMLSSEQDGSEIIWSIAEYVDSNTVREAFQVAKMPAPFGVAPNQPSAMQEESTKLTKVWGTLVACLIGIQVLCGIISRNEAVYSNEFIYSSNSIEKVHTTPTFELKGRRSNVKITFQSPVENNWIEIQGDLINDETGDAVEFERGIEYYHGSDSDGAWSEGSRQTSFFIPNISKGKYHISFEATGPAVPEGIAQPVPAEAVAPDPSAREVYTYWPNKRVRSIEHVKNGYREGLARYYYESGKLKEEVFLRRNQWHGIAKTYREDGTLEQEAGYYNGARHGVSKWYDQSGAAVREEVYSNGASISSMARASVLPIRLSIERDVLRWWNFFWAFILISLYPFMIMWLQRSFEVRRWSQSDYSPYASGDSGDDE